MCETPQSQPPLVARPADVAGSGDLRLHAADGNRPMAFYAEPRHPRGIGVAIIPARLGLLPFYKALAERFAAEGIDAVAVDLYGRTAGAAARHDDFDFETHYEHITRPEGRPQVDADVAAAVEHLGSVRPNQSLFTVGFCFGGSVSWWQSAVDLRLSGCIGLYGAPRYVRDRIPDMRAPLLLVIAGDDRFVPAGDMRQFEGELAAAGVPYEAHTYPGAPHSFFDRRYTQFADAAADAWERILDFIDRHAT